MVYRGITAPIPIGELGVDGRKNPDVIAPGALRVGESIAFSGRIIGHEGGAEKLDSNGISGTPGFLGLHDWHPDVDTQRLVSYCDDGKIYKEVDDDLDSVELKDGLNRSVLGQFISGGNEVFNAGRSLFFCNGQDTVQVLDADGSTMGDIENPATDWATVPVMNMVVHGNSGGGAAVGGYMWALAGKRVYRSSATDHENYTGTSYQLLVPGIALELRAGIVFNGILYVFGDKGVAWLDDSSTDDSKWGFKAKSTQIGIASPQALVGIGNDDVMFMDTFGDFQLLTAVLELSRESGDAKPSSLSNALGLNDYMRDNVNLSRLDKVTMAWYPDRREVHVSVPSKGSQTPDLRLVFDFENRQNPKFRHSERDAPHVITSREHPTEGIEKPIFGDGAGQVYLMDTATPSKDSAGYDKKWEIHPVDFDYFDPRLKYIKKNFDFLGFTYRSLGLQTITVTPIIDGSRKNSTTYEMQGPGAKLGEFKLGTDALGGGAGNFTREKKIYGSGVALGFEVLESGEVGFEITGAYAKFKVGGSKPSAFN